MKQLVTVLTLPLLAACEAPSSVKDTMCSNIAQIYGTWSVSLLYDASQPPSTTEMVLTGDGSETLTGSFYATNFNAAEVASTDGSFVIAGITADGTGDYIHMGRYDCSSDNFEGQTWSRGRGFLMTWTAERTDKS